MRYTLRTILIAFCAILSSFAWSRTADEDLEMGSMGQWKLHLSYCDPTELAASENYIYAQAKEGGLFYLDRKTDQLVYLSKATGLKGTTVSHIAYDKKTKQLVIGYEDGRVDLLDEHDNVRQMPDLQLKAGSLSTDILCITPADRYTYLGTAFGIVALNTKKAEVADTYYIGSDASTVAVQQIVEMGDTLYAFSNDTLYTGHLQDNLANYIVWHKEELPFDQLQQATLWQNRLYVLCDNHLYRRNGGRWERALQESVQWIHANEGQLLLYIDAHLYRMTDDGPVRVNYQYDYAMNTAIYANGEYWAAESNWGLIRLNGTWDDYFHTEGPNTNAGYCMYAIHDKLYTAAGGRWAVDWGRPGRINIYDGSTWRGINEGTIGERVSTHHPPRDISSLAVDPKDPGHFFAAAYGRGVYEFHNYGDDGIDHYITDTINHTNTLREALPKIDIWNYTRTDGATMDEQGNFWVLNATSFSYPLHIVTPDGKWHALNLRSGGANLTMETPAGIWTDKRNKNCRWMFDQRGNTKGIILMDDGGTPTDESDDYCLKRETFEDQNGNLIAPTIFRCWAQDRTNRVWIGTEKGLFTLDPNTDFFKTNACRRIIIPRNDGTGLGDYLLGNEMINCIAADGGNRIWIGTGGSGLYLIEDDTITVAHFTENNSVLPSNTVQSIAIMPKTGEVFVGTDKGIVSYRSDASEPQPSMSGAYAYPNPVRPDYGGLISITGLTENTTVNILDSGGNLVCKTRSNGGTAVWDGKLADGRRATPGVYTALCNSTSGHAAVKILVIR